MIFFRILAVFFLSWNMLWSAPIFAASEDLFDLTRFFDEIPKNYPELLATRILLLEEEKRQAQSELEQVKARLAEGRASTEVLLPVIKEKLEYLIDAIIGDLEATRELDESLFLQYKKCISREPGHFSELDATEEDKLLRDGHKLLWLLYIEVANMRRGFGPTV